MTKKESPPPKRSDSSASLSSDDLRQQRDAFVHTFFKKGAEFTEELLKENERLRAQARGLEQENAALRTQIKSDEAIRDALHKIEQLERDKESLLSRYSAAEANTTRFTARYSEIEEELANLANLYVASYQLHSTMDLAVVVKHLRELLAQLVGARASALYVEDGARRELVPIATDGIEAQGLPRVHLAGGADAPTGHAAAIERAFLTGVAHVHEGELAGAPKDSPVALIPLRTDDRSLGVIVIFEVLPQKERFVPVDFELFKMLAAHGATALAGAMLFRAAGGALPGLSVFDGVSSGSRA
jgi:kynureninase